MIDAEVKQSLLKNGLILFASDYGKKGVAESWTVRLSKQIKQLDQFKDFSNVNIATGGDSLIVDVDLDCPEALELADAFLNPTGMMFGRESTPRSHRLYKVIDLNKKHTRAYFDFKDKEKSMLVELRANKHYTMCGGQYDNGEKVVWDKCDMPVEITYDTLHKQLSKLAVACVVLRKAPTPGTKMRNEYWKLVIATLWYHKIKEEDCINIVEAVCNAHKDDTNERLARVKNIYAKDRTEQLQGLTTLAKQFNWSDDEVKDLKKLLFKITGRHLLPEFTNEFVNRIAYMMKQKKYYDLEDKEMYDAEAIDVKYSKHFDGRYTPLKYWKQHKDSRVCVDFAYKPDNDKRFITVNKKLMINVYEKHELQPDPKADTDLFDALVEHVIPHDDYREHFLNWFAYPIQNPGKKIRHALLLQSDEYQLGKGSLFDIHRDLIGYHNTNKIDLKEALDKAKGYLINKQTVLIDEAKASGSWNEKNMFLNTLKTLITEGKAGVRQMYKDYTEQDTITNYWINTNYRDAFPLPYNEVRYFVYFSPAKRNEKMLDDFHEQRLYGDLTQGVLAKLMDRDLSKFKPLGIAPQTPYLMEMRKMADRPIADYIREEYNQGMHPFDRDLVSVTELFSWLGKNTKIRVTRQREIADAIKDLGGVLKKSCAVKGMGKYVNIWIIRDHDKYKNLTAEQVGAKYVPFYTGEF
mgnify:FL=1|jgi:hypothetical protein|tara:strand:- start:695 stop:2767 length:2073 start_codon:yes stop_codon:yes gene_type:complete